MNDNPNHTTCRGVMILLLSDQTYEVSKQNTKQNKTKLREEKTEQNTKKKRKEKKTEQNKTHTKKEQNTQ